LSFWIKKYVIVTTLPGVIIRYKSAGKIAEHVKMADSIVEEAFLVLVG